MSFAEHLPAFFADFGVDATWKGTTVRGLFDSDFAETLNYIAGHKTALLCMTADMPGVAENDAISLSAVNYTIAAVQDDGTGLTRLILEKA